MKEYMLFVSPIGKDLSPASQDKFIGFSPLKKIETHFVQGTETGFSWNFQEIFFTFEHSYFLL